MQACLTMKDDRHGYIHHAWILPPIKCLYACFPQTRDLIKLGVPPPNEDRFVVTFPEDIKHIMTVRWVPLCVSYCHQALINPTGGEHWVQYVFQE